MHAKLVEQVVEARDALGIALAVAVPLFLNHRGAAGNGELAQALSDAGLPVFYSIRDAARAMRRLLDWDTRRQQRAADANTGDAS